MISGKAMVCGVIGNPVGHSLSPMMHNYYGEALKLDYIYVPCNVDDDKVVRRSAVLMLWDLRELM